MDKAAGDAFLIDGLITAGLIVTGYLPVVGISGVIYIISKNIAGAIAGYTIRKTIDEYYKEDTTSDYAIRIFGGTVGGAMKYGISKGFALDKMIIGAVNNALYEYMKKPIGANIENGNVAGLFSTVWQIEFIDNIIDEILKRPVLIEYSNKIGSEFSDFEVLSFEMIWLSHMISCTIATSVLSMSIWTFDNEKGYTELDYNRKNIVDGPLVHTYTLMMGTPIKTETDNIDNIKNGDQYTFTCPASETLDNTNGDQ
jgi:hypothetical protein